MKPPKADHLKGLCKAMGAAMLVLAAGIEKGTIHHVCLAVGTFFATYGAFLSNPNKAD